MSKILPFTNIVVLLSSIKLMVLLYSVIERQVSSLRVGKIMPIGLSVKKAFKGSGMVVLPFLVLVSFTAYPTWYDCSRKFTPFIVPLFVPTKIDSRIEEISL